MATFHHIIRFFKKHETDRGLITLHYDRVVKLKRHLGKKREGDRSDLVALEKISDYSYDPFTAWDVTVTGAGVTTGCVNGFKFAVVAAEDVSGFTVKGKIYPTVTVAGPGTGPSSEPGPIVDAIQAYTFTPPDDDSAVSATFKVDATPAWYFADGKLTGAVCAAPAAGTPADSDLPVNCLVVWVTPDIAATPVAWFPPTVIDFYGRQKV